MCSSLNQSRGQSGEKYSDWLLLGHKPTLGVLVMNKPKVDVPTPPGLSKRAVELGEGHLQRKT